MGDVVNISYKKEKLQDVVAAFMFSRLPREQRIAEILKQVLINQGYLHGFVSSDDLQFNENAEVKMVEIGKELAEYSVKDFAVRYGHLGDGLAKT